MSRVTNPETEISVSCGFYDSIGDRKYTASQMSSIFDGIIRDGIFSSIGDCLVVKANSGTVVNVGVGKAWFNRTWTLNEAPLPIDCGDANEILNRWDAIVLEVNADESVRDNSIKVIKGVEATNAVKPTLVKDGKVHQYALCYIERKKGSTEITQSDIENVIGTEETPFVTGILEVISIDKLLGQWRDQLNRFIASEEERATIEISSYIERNESDFNEWYAGMKQLMEDVTVELDTWTEAQKNTILDWFEHMKDQLSDDAAINLQIQIDKDEIRHVLSHGFIDGTKTFSKDGSVITSVDSHNRTLKKTFTDKFLTCTTVLIDKYGTELGRMVKFFSEDGSTIRTTTTIADDDTIIRNGDNTEY